MTNENGTCELHQILTRDQEKLFELLAKRVPSWVFTMVVSAAVGLFGILVAIQFNMISGTGKQMDRVVKTMTKVQMSMVEVKAEVDNFGARFDSFERYNDRELDTFRRDIKELHEFHEK